MIFINSSERNTLKMFQPFLPIFVPIGIGCLLALFEQEKIPVWFIDEQIEDNTLEAVETLVSKMQKPYIFGFSVLTAAFKKSVFISEQLKIRYPDCIILFGGIHPTAMPDEVLAYKHIDIVVKGEGESVILDLYRHIKAGKSYSHLKNISYKKDGRIIHNPKESVLVDIDRLPHFPYHLFTSPGYDLGFVLSSRGCPYECIFCSNRVVTGRRYRFRSPESIVEDLELLYKKYNRNYVLFLDDNFLVSKERVYALIDVIKKKGLHTCMTFNFQARADHVDKPLLKDLFDAGFRSIFFGIESSSNRVLNIIKKNETIEQCINAVKMSKEMGFHVSATFIYALPTETYEDRMECVRLSRALNLDMVRYNNATPYPGTELYDIVQNQKRLKVKGLYENFNSVSTFVENPFKKIPFSYVPEGCTEDEIRRDILYSYFAFYFDIHRIKSIFMQPNKGVGWFKAGEKFKEFLKKIPALTFLFFMFVFKFFQLFYLMVIRKSTRRPFKKFLSIFKGLMPR